MHRVEDLHHASQPSIHLVVDIYVNPVVRQDYPAARKNVNHAHQEEDLLKNVSLQNQISHLLANAWLAELFTCVDHGEHKRQKVNALQDDGKDVCNLPDVVLSDLATSYGLAI